MLEGAKTMEEIFTRAWRDLIGREGGPLSFRLIIQPMVAALLAIRAGLRDAREGRTPYFWALVSSPAHRRNLVQEGWKDVGKVFVLAVVLDVIYQLMVFRWLYPVETLLVATVLAILPYLAIRGPVTRIARSRR
jgi:hypothetical protein